MDLQNLSCKKTLYPSNNNFPFTVVFKLELKSWTLLILYNVLITSFVRKSKIFKCIFLSKVKDTFFPNSDHLFTFLQVAYRFLSPTHSKISEGGHKSYPWTVSRLASLNLPLTWGSGVSCPLTIELSSFHIKFPEAISSYPPSLPFPLNLQQLWHTGLISHFSPAAWVPTWVGSSFLKPGS